MKDWLRGLSMKEKPGCIWNLGKLVLAENSRSVQMKVRLFRGALQLVHLLKSLSLVNSAQPLSVCGVPGTTVTQAVLHQGSRGINFLHSLSSDMSNLYS